MESYLNHKRIIISTDTKELQTQLIKKDIPNVIQSLGLEDKIRFGYIKGKSNYICVEKLEKYIKKAEQLKEELSKDGIEASVITEEPFVEVKDSIEFKVYVLVEKKSILNQKNYYIKLTDSNDFRML